MKSKLLNLAVVLLVIVYVCFNFKGQIRLEYACPNYHTATEVTKEVVKEVIKEVNYTALMEKLNEEKCAQDDPRLIKLIRERYLEPPSTLPYNLTNPNRPDYSEFGQTRVVEMHLNNMEGGFFVECGGYDGETSSNSLTFEKTRKWRGLLIEADPGHYAILKSKNRNAYTINACLTITPYPVVMTFNKQVDQRGRVVHGQESLDWIKRQGFPKNEIQIQCFPLYSLLLALNQTTVNFLSLDVEGDELYVLKTIPFDKVDIKMMTVEHNNQRTPPSVLIQYLRDKGYVDIQRLGVDVIFRKKIIR